MEVFVLPLFELEEALVPDLSHVVLCLFGVLGGALYGGGAGVREAVHLAHLPFLLVLMLYLLVLFQLIVDLVVDRVCFFILLQLYFLLKEMS